GDSVTISATDPLQDKLAEGTISDLRPGTLIVQLRGVFPEDCQKKLWRVDKSANATVYERHMWVRRASAQGHRDAAIAQTAAPVGMADRWAMRWQATAQAGIGAKAANHRVREGGSSFEIERRDVGEQLLKRCFQRIRGRAC
ncbi:Hypothetical protein (Fragment), partial [Durusdinium trenchii]